MPLEFLAACLPLTSTDDLGALKKALKSAFSCIDAVLRLIKLTPCDSAEQAPRYSLKFRLERRVGLDHAERFNPRTGYRAPGATTKQRLRLAERLELVLYLNAIDIDSRVVTMGTKIQRTKAGPVIISI